MTGIYYCFDKAAAQRPFSGSGLPFLCIGSNCFTDLLGVDNCNGLQVVSACLLARERKSLENNANVFQVCLWQQGYCDHRLLRGFHHNTIKVKIGIEQKE